MEKSAIHRIRLSDSRAAPPSGPTRVKFRHALTCITPASLCRDLQQVDEDETLLRFVVALRRQSPKGLHIGPAAKKRVSQSKPERAPPS